MSDNVSERHIRAIIAPEPGDRGVLTLDAKTQTVRSAPRSLMAMIIGGGRWFSVPVGGARFLVFRRAGDLLCWNPAHFARLWHAPRILKTGDDSPAFAVYW